LIFAAGSAFALTLHAATKGGPINAATGSFAVTNITVIDGTGSAPQPDRTVVVADGRIVYVGQGGARRADSTGPDIDGRGKFLLPGLIQREVAAQAAAKVVFLKIYGNLPPELVAAAIREAHSRHLRVIGHA
jgi:hypothetical protein